MRSVFQGLPSIYIEGRSVYTFTMHTIVNGGVCPVNLYVDGLRTNTEAIQSYRPDQIVAVEWYARASQVPAQYQTVGSLCATLLVWTRFM